MEDTVCKKRGVAWAEVADRPANTAVRVCQPGSVEVTEFMQIEKYSHVMHIVSTVIGKLLSNKILLSFVRQLAPVLVFT